MGREAGPAPTHPLSTLMRTRVCYFIVLLLSIFIVLLFVFILYLLCSDEDNLFCLEKLKNDVGWENELKIYKEDFYLFIYITMFLEVEVYN